MTGAAGVPSTYLRISFWRATLPGRLHEQHWELDKSKSRDPTLTAYFDSFANEDITKDFRMLLRQIPPGWELYTVWASPTRDAKGLFQIGTLTSKSYITSTLARRRANFLPSPALKATASKTWQDAASCRPRPGRPTFGLCRAT